MSDDWLWDGAPPDAPEDKAIVDTLASLRRERPCPPLPDRAPIEAPRRGRPVVRALAALTTLLAAAALAWIWAPRDGWEVRAVAGDRPCVVGPCRLAAGEDLRPPVGSTWEVSLDEAGTIEVSGGASLRRTTSTEGYRLRLDEGTLTASIVAAPGALVVETPAAQVVDLGCAFTLTATAETTELSVQDGSVALRNEAGTSIVTAGSAARVELGARPRLPVRVDASPELRAAVEAVEGVADRDNFAAQVSVLSLLDRATPKDLLTLWHVLQVVPRAERTPVIERMERLAPGCAAEREPVLDLQPDALRSLWQYLAPFALGSNPVAGPW